MKKILLILLAFIAVFLFVGCSSEELSDPLTAEPSSEVDGPTPDAAEPLTEGDYPDGDYKADDDAYMGEVGDEEPSNTEPPQAGQMSASEWSDLKNYSFWKSLFESNQDSKEGIFGEYLNKGYFNTLNMIDVTIKNNEDFVSGVAVELINNDQKVIFKSVTNMNGKAFLFPDDDDLTSISQIVITVGENKITNDYTYSSENSSLEYNIGQGNLAEKKIEIMFVIDTTGSMGDEITYLKAEIDYVISEVKGQNPEAEVLLALLFYRDLEDTYITRYFDFTADIEEQKKNLGAQSAGGGGDFEEAVDIALDEAVSKNWSSSNTTKLLFHVLDAPPHYTEKTMTKYANAIKEASNKGIRMIPLASSGIDKYTEYLLRNEAMMTGGTYTFITNHSGIGGDHIEATTGETEVEYLNMMLIRLINEYYTGIPQDKVLYPTGESK